jgi:hypothetical protein
VANLRDPVSVGNVSVSAFPAENHDLELTGTSPLFRVRVQNDKDTPARGTLEMIWTLGQDLTKRDIPYDVPPKNHRDYDLPREYLASEGTAIYRVLLPRQGQVVRPAEPQPSLLTFAHHFLCSTLVQDRASYGQELRYRDRTVRNQTLTLILVGISVVVAVVTAILIH